MLEENQIYMSNLVSVLNWTILQFDLILRKNDGKSSLFHC